MYYIRGKTLKTWVKQEDNSTNLVELSALFSIEDEIEIHVFHFFATASRSGEDWRASYSQKDGKTVPGYNKFQNGRNSHAPVGVNSGKAASISEFLPNETDAKASIKTRSPGFFDFILSYNFRGRTYNALLIPYLGKPPLFTDLVGTIFFVTKEDLSGMSDYEKALMRIYS